MTAAIGVITPPVVAVLNAVINVSNVPFASAAKGAFLVLPGPVSATGDSPCILVPVN